MKRPGNCGRPWRRSAPTRRRRPGSTTSRPWCTKPKAPVCETHLTIEGQQISVPPAVDRTAYRIVQESLTNINRHAAATIASVRIDYRPDALVIQVDDDGTATSNTAPSPGVGLLGMRERVTALGGQLRAAPRSEGGFTVHAELPVRPRP